MSHGIQLPIACTLSAEEIRAGADGLLPGLIADALEVRERSDGLTLRFDATEGIVQRLAAVIERERRCCAFLRFRLTMEPAAGPVWLDVTGPDGTLELLLQLGSVGGRVSDGIERTQPGGAP